MSSPAHRARYEWADYLALEASSNVKHEFLDGQIYAMAGGTPEHAALAAAMIGTLFGQLRPGPCRVHDSDLRVRVLATGLATYPDATVVCGPLERDPADENAVTNPTLIAEVLSRSTKSTIAATSSSITSASRRCASTSSFLTARARSRSGHAARPAPGPVSPRATVNRQCSPPFTPASTSGSSTKPLSSRRREDALLARFGVAPPPMMGEQKQPIC